MDEWTRRLIALALVVVANVAPWACGRLFGTRFNLPLDVGHTLADGSRLLGDHKTWRGLIAGALACMLFTQLLGRGWGLGLAFGALSLAADLASSFAKRRLGVAPGREFPILDQLPEALLPLIVLARPLGLSIPECLGIAAVFSALDLATVRLRHTPLR
jgi:CDP-2,3-bis-(O-geranylgeranyl)-sn-glycerol synthase